MAYSLYMTNDPIFQSNIHFTFTPRWLAYKCPRKITRKKTSIRCQFTNWINLHNSMALFNCLKKFPLTVELLSCFGFTSLYICYFNSTGKLKLSEVVLARTSLISIWPRNEGTSLSVNDNTVHLVKPETKIKRLLRQDTSHSFIPLMLMLITVNHQDLFLIK